MIDLKPPPTKSATIDVRREQRLATGVVFAIAVVLLASLAWCILSGFFMTLLATLTLWGGY